MNDGMSPSFVKHNERLIMKKLFALALVTVGLGRLKRRYESKYARFYR
jgi:hypothetical protein